MHILRNFIIWTLLPFYWTFIKEIKPGNPKGNQPWIFTGRTDIEADTPIVWPPDVNRQLIGDKQTKKHVAGKNWRQEIKETIEDEMVGWYHWSKDMSLRKFQEIVKDRDSCHAAVHGVAKSRTWLRDWTTIIYLIVMLLLE